MKKFTKIFVILGVVLCLCGGVVTATGYFGGGFQELSPRSTYAAQRSSMNQKNLTFSTDEIDLLEFRLESEDISILPSDDGQIHIRYQQHDKVKYNVYTTQSSESGSNTLVFARNASSAASQSFHFGFNFESDSPDVQVLLPQGLSLDIFTTSGNAELSDVTAQTLSIATSSGDVDLSQTQADTLTLSSTSGDLELDQVTAAESASLETTSGELELKNCTINAPVTIYTVSGDLDGQAVISGDLTISTTSGDVDLNLSGSPAHASGEISTVSGELDLQGLQPKADYSVNISTVSGDVTLRH